MILRWSKIKFLIKTLRVATYLDQISSKMQRKYNTYMAQIVVKMQVFKQQKYYSFQNQDPQTSDAKTIS